MVALSLAVIVSIRFSFLGSAPFWVLVMLGAMLAGVTAPLYGLGAGQTNDRVARSDYVAASGGLLFGWAVGSSVGPVVAGVIMARAGTNALFVFLAVTLLALSGFTLLRMRQRKGVESESAYVPARRAPSILPELDEPPSP